MDTIKIKCPNCGAILSVHDDPSNEGKSVRCPACNEKHQFLEFRLVTPMQEDDKTRIGGISQAEDETKLPGFSRVSIGYLLNEADGHKYALSEGINLIGRMTYQQAPLANVPIETDDRGFSRKHLYIDVTKGADGKYRHYAYNAANKNATTVNESLLEEGDKVILHTGDRIESSKTVLVFKL